MSVAALSPARAALLRRRIRWIVGATIAYNVAEAAIALTAGAAANSSALLGFGLDSVVEVASAVFVAWQFSASDPSRREHLTMRLIAGAFFALALVVSADAVTSLVTASAPETSVVGIWLAALSLAIMPTVAWFERSTGKELGSATAVADSRQLILCSYLSAALLVGLLLNTTLGWWWADPLAALVIAGFAVREGREAWKGDGCCATSGALLHGDEAPCADACCEPVGTSKVIAVDQTSDSCGYDDCCATHSGAAPGKHRDRGPSR